MKTALFSLIIAIGVAFLSVFQFVKYQNLAIESRQNLKQLDDSVNERFAALKKEVEWLAAQEQSLMQQTAHLAEFHGNVPECMQQHGQAPNMPGQIPGHPGQIPGTSRVPGQAQTQTPGHTQAPQTSAQAASSSVAPSLTPQQIQQTTQQLQAQLHSQLQTQLQTQLKSELQTEMHNQLQSELQKELQKQNVTFALSESLFLVQTADLRLKAIQDVKAASLLLTSALDKIQTLKDPKYANLKTALDADIAALQAVSNQNGSELWLKTSQLIAKAKELPLRSNLAQPNLTANVSANAGSNNSLSTTSTTDAATQNTINTSEKLTWKENIRKSWQEIKDLVKIRHHTKPVEPLLSLNEQTLVKENLRLLLEQVRFAILNTDDAIYRQAIQESQQWLSFYFDEGNEAVKSIQSDLTQLANVELQPKLPKLQSLEAFNSIK